MAEGIRITNSAGQTSFDTSRIGGVVLTMQLVGPSANNATYTYTYTVPANSRVRPVPLLGPIQARFLVITATVSGTQLTVTVTYPNSTSTGSYFFLLILLY